MSSTAPASPRKVDHEQRGRGRGRGGPRRRYWGGRCGRGGRGRGVRDREGRGRGGAGRGRAEPSKAHGGEEIDSDNNDAMKLPQDQSDAMYNESMTTMLKKQLGLGNDDSAAPTNAESDNPAPSAAVTTTTAVSDTSKQRRADKKQHNTARGKPNQNKKRSKPKNNNQEGKENSHHDHHHHHHHHRHLEHAPSAELVLPPSPYDDQATSNCNGKQYSSTNHRTRPKPNQKKHPKKSTQPGKENVCSQDSNDKRSSITWDPPKHDGEDTTIISKTKKVKRAKSANKQGKESQKKNQPNKSLDSTKSCPPADHDVVSTDTHLKPKKEKLTMKALNKYGKRGQKKTQLNKSSESDSSKIFPPTDHDAMNTATYPEPKKEKPATMPPNSQGKENQKNTQPNKSSYSSSTKTFLSAKHDAMNTHGRPKPKKEKPATKSANRKGKVSQEKPQLNKFSDSGSTKTFQTGEHDVADTTTRPEPKMEKPATKSAIQQENASQENTQPNKSLDSDSTKTFLPAEHGVADTVTRPKPKQEKLAMRSLTVQGKEKKKPSNFSDSTKTSPSENHHVLDTGTPTIAKTPMQLERDNEKERMNRLLQEEREKLAAAKEKKKSKRSKKHDKWIKEQEFERSKRAKSWHEKIAKDNESVDLISHLIVTEFLRQNKHAGLAITKEQVLQDSHAFQAITNESRHINDIIFGGIKCRVKVVALDRQDLDGRQGTLRHWDDKREKFYVGLDTKKLADSDVHYLVPENIESQAAPRTSKAGKKSMQDYDVDIKNFSNQRSEGIWCRFTLEKSAMDALHAAESIERGLEIFCLERDENEQRLRLELEEEHRQEEEYRKQEELDRKRRAVRRAKERAERERCKEQRRREGEEATRVELKMMRAQMKHQEEKSFHKLRLKFKLFEALQREILPEDIFDFLEAEGFGDFDSDDDDEFRWYNKFFEDMENDYKNAFREENEENSREMAEILGVEPDVDERTLKVTYRKLALKLHPDKWRSDSDHGMTREESLEHFKTIQNAYDCLMSRFDNEYGDAQ